MSPSTSPLEGHDQTDCPPADFHLALFDQSIDAVFLFDHEGRTIDVNPTGCELLGYAREELIGVYYPDLVPPEDLATDPVVFDDILAGRTVVRERRLRRKDGRVVLVELKARMLADGRILGMARDITESKRAEEALREQVRLNQTLLDALPCVALLLRPGSREIVASNRAAVEVGAIPGRQCFATWHQREEPCPWCLAPEVWAIGEPRHLEVEAGRIVWDAHWIPISDDLYMHYAFDITDRWKLQAQLRQAQKMDAVGRLAGGVAHDFNNMLGVIIGHAELALEQLEERHPVRDDLERVREAAQRSADLTRQLLAFARRQAVSPKVLDLNETVAGTLAMLRRLVGEEIALQWMPGPDPWCVRIDPSQVDQILANLVVNGRDAIEGSGAIALETANEVLGDAFCAEHRGAYPGEYVLLAISDTGVGMTEEVLGNLFEPFFTTKELGQGTGLGLATVYGIVKQNDGYIDVHSAPGLGTTVSIYLPRHHAAPVAAEPEPEEKPRAVGAETVLIVEDEEAILNVASTILKLHGYAVLTARTPAEALALADKHPGTIDLLITDVILPDMNGREVRDHLLQMRPGLRCLFISGYPADAIVHQGILEEGVNFLPKPFTVQELTKRVREILG